MTQLLTSFRLPLFALLSLANLSGCSDAEPAQDKSATERSVAAAKAAPSVPSPAPASSSAPAPAPFAPEAVPAPVAWPEAELIEPDVQLKDDADAAGMTARLPTANVPAETAKDSTP